MHKTLEEMQELAVKTFGEDVEVAYNSLQGWTIQTQIKEPPFSWEGLEDTPAYGANQRGENGESELERWGRKNGYGWCSMRELVEAYNECQRQGWESYVRTCRKFLEDRGIEVPNDTEKIVQYANDLLDRELGL